MFGASVWYESIDYVVIIYIYIYKIYILLLIEENATLLSS